MTNALENDSWFATSATDRERFRVFRHTLAEKATPPRPLAGGEQKLQFGLPIDYAQGCLRCRR